MSDVPPKTDNIADEQMPSYKPLGSAEDIVECEDDGQLERRHLMTDGLYWNVEFGEGPTGWI